MDIPEKPNIIESATNPFDHAGIFRVSPADPPKTNGLSNEPSEEPSTEPAEDLAVEYITTPLPNGAVELPPAVAHPIRPQGHKINLAKYELLGITSVHTNGGSLAITLCSDIVKRYDLAKGDRVGQYMDADGNILLIPQYYNPDVRLIKRPEFKKRRARVLKLDHTEIDALTLLRAEELRKAKELKAAAEREAALAPKPRKIVSL